jgi:DNA-binding transcriptional MerR regulator
VREVPDLRAIRYYSTLGLLDRPAAFRGRTALYGKRHLAQLVAIKRLQAQGLPLADVQRRLAELDEHGLLKLAALPHDAEAAELHVPRAPSEEAAPRVREFIAAPAAALKEGPQLQSAPLDAKVLLVLEGARALDETDLEAIRAAAAPLLKLLQKRGLLKPHDPEES